MRDELPEQPGGTQPAGGHEEHATLAAAYNAGWTKREAKVAKERIGGLAIECLEGVLPQPVPAQASRTKRGLLVRTVSDGAGVEERDAARWRGAHTCGTYAYVVGKGPGERQQRLLQRVAEAGG